MPEIMTNISLKYTSLIVAVLLSFMSYGQQVNRRSQYSINPYFVNPAVAGTLNQIPIYATYRNQWAGFKGAPTTYMASFHAQGPKNSGYGAILSHDNTGGAISETSLEATGAYHIELNNYDAVSFGLSLTASQYKFDNGKLTVYDVDDIALNGGQAETRLNLDANFGFMVYGSNYYFGASVPQLVQSKLKLTAALDPSDNRNMRHYQVMGSYKYSVNGTWDIQPSAFMRFTPVTPVQMDLNVRATYLESLWGGLSVRPKEGLGMYLGAYKQNFLFGYSFDYSTNMTKMLSPFAHEVIVGYIIPGKRGRYFAKGALGPRVLEKGRVKK
jgi:type IX secretion system PorP/SprF family membrane protein